MASKVAKFKRRRNSADSIKNLAMDTGAAFGGYVAGRFAGRFAFKMAVERNPKLAKHAPVVGAGLAALATYYGTQFWDKAKPYSEAATIGAGVAFAQSVVQSYVPNLALLVSDPRASEYARKSAPAKPAPGPAQVDDGGDDLDQFLEANDLEAVPFELPSGEGSGMGDFSDSELDEMLLQ